MSSFDIFSFQRPARRLCLSLDVRFLVMNASLKYLALVLMLNCFASSVFGDTAEDFYTNGIANATKGDFVGAVADFSKAIELRTDYIILNPKFVEAYVNRG